MFKYSAFVCKRRSKDGVWLGKNLQNIFYGRPLNRSISPILARFESESNCLLIGFHLNSFIIKLFGQKLRFDDAQILVKSAQFRTNILGKNIYLALCL